MQNGQQVICTFTVFTEIKFLMFVFILATNLKTSNATQFTVGKLAHKDLTFV